MFGLIRKKELSAFAERVHNDNAPSLPEVVVR